MPVGAAVGLWTGVAVPDGVADGFGVWLAADVGEAPGAAVGDAVGSGVGIAVCVGVAVFVGVGGRNCPRIATGACSTRIISGPPMSQLGIPHSAGGSAMRYHPAAGSTADEAPSVETSVAEEALAATFADTQSEVQFQSTVVVLSP